MILGLLRLLQKILGQGVDPYQKESKRSRTRWYFFDFVPVIEESDFNLLAFLPEYIDKIS